MAEAVGSRRKRPSGRRVGWAALVLVFVLAAAPSMGAAQPRLEAGSPQACVLAHEQGLTRTDSGDWLAARADFQRCVEAACPKVVRQECGAELYRLRQRIPSIVFAARDTSGQDLIAVRVYSNGKLLLDQLGLQGVAMNPGKYRFDLVAPNGARVSRDVLLREGELDRRVEAVFPVGASSEAASGSGSRVWTVPVTLSVAVAATSLGVFGVFAVRGKSTEGCKPDCTQQEVDGIRRDYLVADVALGVAVAAGATGAILVWRQTRARSAVSAQVSGRPGGGVVGAEVRF